MSELISTKSEINTNMKAVELKGRIVNQLSNMSQEEIDSAVSTIANFIAKEGMPTYMMLLSNERRYFTTFKLNSKDADLSAAEIVEFLITETYFAEFGGLKLIEESTGHIEVWMGDQFFALFNYDTFVVHI
jgi:hypothetical protein